MSAFQKILVPTDFSEVSAAALRCAAALAEPFGSSLTVLHVAEDLMAEANSAGAGAPWSEGVQEQTEGESRGRLAEVVTGAGLDGLNVRTELLVGSPIPEILGYAEKHEFDLIVMGTHGRRAIARVLLGSVAECVVRLSPCPVLTVRVCRKRPAAS